MFAFTNVFVYFFIEVFYKSSFLIGNRSQASTPPHPAVQGGLPEAQ